MKESVSSKMREIIKRLPKTDLHVHLDGSIRLETLVEIARKEKLDLPGFKRSFFPESYAEKRRYVRRCIDYYERLTEGIPELEA